MLVIAIGLGTFPANIQYCGKTNDNEALRSVNILIELSSKAFDISNKTFIMKLIKTDF